ncbi:hypothetical protein Cgig2_011162 [Carnegiea gigantea]|uniref:Uncharacterized protein n=1 Tax=Carnegiea gigantea TaxID=171969 RepID=A0A9Q1KDF8_9CARY|nr:hypothetical protein Cgig2_011162 [Carnegiea gigantea]
MIRLPLCFADKLKARNLRSTSWSLTCPRPTIGLNISIQGVSCLIPCTITLAGRRNKLHLLGVLALVLGPLALVEVVEVGLKSLLYRVTSPSSLRHFAMAITPRANALAIVTSSSMILGGSEVPEVAKSQDLTKSWTSENLAEGSALMKLVDDRWAFMGEPLTA